MAWGGHYTRHIAYTTKMAQDHLPWGVIVPFFLIAALLNKLIQKTRPQSVLTSTELRVIFAMAIVGSALPSYFMAHLIANIAAPIYYPSAENGWATDLLPNIPTWAILTDQQAARWFFEGLPTGNSIPWESWATPLFWRMSLVASIGVFCFCTVAILRKQWVEHERLVFPLMALPLNSMDTDREGSSGFWTIAFLNKRIFWLGFGLGSITIFWNMISYFVPLFPTIPVGYPPFQFGPQFPPIPTMVYPLIIGSTYFIDLDISFSIIVFRLMLTLEMGFLNRLGADIGETHAAGNTEFENWQDLGGLFLIVPWNLWMAREHLMSVWRKAFYKDPNVDDSRELLPYRSTLWGWIGSAIFIVAWCVASGMSIVTASVFFGLVFVIWMGIARMSIEGGLISTRTIQAQFPVVRILGATNMSSTGLVAIAMTKNWHHDMKTALIAPMANATKVMDTAREHRSKLVLAMVIAVVVVAGGSAYYAIASGYETGAYNYGSIYADSVQGKFDTAVGYIRDPFGVKRFRARWSLLGFGTVALMSGLRLAFPWWPIHPIGFLTATTYPAKRVVLSIFIGWLVKLGILRTGGIGLYRKATPFFLGMMLGYFSGIGISFIVDCIWFPARGHSLGLY